jgi:hypothetical protein
MALAPFAPGGILLEGLKVYEVPLGWGPPGVGGRGGMNTRTLTGLQGGQHMCVHRNGGKSTSERGARVHAYKQL